MQAIIKLSEFRTVKFPSLLQHFLYFLGYTKNDIDIPSNFGSLCRHHPLELEESA